eukprot:GHVN01085194.1.p1 GENE.GHVN01085194.1~~GHVN01085194.1.p1  ORF type:complete len:713 (-),score=116.23 GHVN01085194.1:404-2542(-)
MRLGVLRGWRRPIGSRRCFNSTQKSTLEIFRPHECPVGQAWPIDPYQSLRQLLPTLCYFGHTETLVANVVHRATEAYDAHDSQRMKAHKSDFFSGCGLAFDMCLSRDPEVRPTGGGEMIFACVNPSYLNMIAPDIRTTRKMGIINTVRETLQLFVELNRDLFATVDQHRLMEFTSVNEFVKWKNLMGLDLRSMSSAGIHQILTHAFQRKQYSLALDIYGSLLSQHQPAVTEDLNKVIHHEVIDLSSLQLNTRIRDTRWSLSKLLNEAVARKSFPFLVEIFKILPTGRLMNEAYHYLTYRSSDTGLLRSEWASHAAKALKTEILRRKQSHFTIDADKRQERLALQGDFVPLDDTRGVFKINGEVNDMVSAYLSFQRAVDGMRDESASVAVFSPWLKKKADISSQLLDSPCDMADIQSTLDIEAKVRLDCARICESSETTASDFRGPDKPRSFKDVGPYLNRVSFSVYPPRRRRLAMMDPILHLRNIAFPLPLARIHFVGVPSEVGEMYQHVKECDRVSLQVEWGGPSEHDTASLLVLATWSNVFVIECNRLSEVDDLYVDLLLDFLQWLIRSSILKISYKWDVDFTRLATAFINTKRRGGDRADGGNGGDDQGDRGESGDRLLVEDPAMVRNVTDLYERCGENRSFESLCANFLGGVPFIAPGTADWTARPLMFPLRMKCANDVYAMLIIDAVMRQEDEIRGLGEGIEASVGG